MDGPRQKGFANQKEICKILFYQRLAGIQTSMNEQVIAKLAKKFEPFQEANHIGTQRFVQPALKRRWIVGMARMPGYAQTFERRPPAVVEPGGQYGGVSLLEGLQKVLVVISQQVSLLDAFVAKAMVQVVQHSERVGAFIDIVAQVNDALRGCIGFVGAFENQTLQRAK